MKKGMSQTGKKKKKEQKKKCGLLGGGALDGELRGLML